MIASGTRAGFPLLLDLLEERRRARAALIDAVTEAGGDPAKIEAAEAHEATQRRAGHPARALAEVLEEQGLIERECAMAVCAAARSGTSAYTPQNLQALREAQSQSNLGLEAAVVKLGYAEEQEIADTYAEYLRMPLAGVVPIPRFGDLAVLLLVARGEDEKVVRQCVEQAMLQHGSVDGSAMVGSLLVEQGLMTDDEVQEVMRQQAELSDKLIPLDMSLDDAKRLPEKFCREHAMIATRFRDGVLHLAMANPIHMMAIEQAQHLAEAVVHAGVAPISAVLRSLDRAFGARDVIREMVRDVPEASESENKDDGLVLDLHQTAPNGKDGWIIRLANSILEGAIRQRASDVHLEPFENDAKVRYRIDGVLREITPPSKSSFVPLVSRFKILARMDIAERRVPQDGAIALRLGDMRVDVRVSTVPTVYGEKMVMRLLNKDGVPLDLRKLGFGEEQVVAFGEAIRRPHGLLFVTGPTGSGKSTTLYAALHQLNRPGCNIMTAEDPVEYKMRGLNQVHVRSNVGMTFASALRAFLRQDPDVIMVGEVRDRETAEICLRAALTGHFVLSTLHTNDSLSAVARLNDMGVEPFLLAATLRLVEAQRLVRRLCPECKEPYDLDVETAGRVGLEPGIPLYRPGSCKECHGTGYRGRVGLYEVIPVTPPLRDLIQKKASVVELQKAAKEAGFKFLRDAGLAKVEEGVTSLEEVLTIALGED